MTHYDSWGKIVYKCEEFRDCQYKSSFIKGNNSKTPLENRTKNLQVSKLFHEKRKIKENYKTRGM
ncbi:hypothetical protein BN173_3290005 [Clostridioides difficile T11]|nr:hypothetical protein BN173_3290005 [Clostridioides difficile T11]CCL39937.1 hypothetical protein BN176_3210003 [Clostridioides difficile E19]